jgi:antitoxin CptB
MDDTRLKRLRFRAWRRGFLEADLILGPFADSHVQSLTDDEVEAFEALLDHTDHDVYAWVIGTDTPPPAFDTALLARIRDFHQRAG